MKALFGLWAEFGVKDLNRVLKPHGVRLVLKKSKEWGKQVNVTAHPITARKPRAVVVVPPANAGGAAAGS